MIQKVSAMRQVPRVAIKQIQNQASGFKRLQIWRTGMELAKLVYEITNNFPGEEKFGLVAQLRRAAVSVPSNIAEGYSRRNDKEFKQFLYIALGSLGELETQVLLSIDFGFLNQEESLCKLMTYERSMVLKICHHKGEKNE